MSTQEKFRLHDEIIQRLKDLGVTQNDILKTQKLWITAFCSILEAQIEDAVHKALPNTDAKKEILQVIKSNGKDGLPLPDALKNWVAAKGLNDHEINERVEEYERVWTTGTMKNPTLIPFGVQPSPLPEYRSNP
jgi:hypothetical protein